MKHYDRAYFDRWYRHPDSRVLLASALERKVALAVSAAEFVLSRRIRSVLDVGCGEGAWRAELRRLRPRIRYVGVDSSSYAVTRFGRRRGIVKGRVGDLGSIGLDGPFDLVVCSDVLHYVTDAELERGIRAIARMTVGLAWIEVFTASDDTIGDSHEYRERPPASYDRVFRRAGLTAIGLFCFVPRAVRETLTTFEKAPRA